MLDFAILTPVPEHHLRSGLELRCGLIALGCDEPEFFERVDELREGAPVRVFLYGSGSGAPEDGTYRVAWTGWYVGSVSAEEGRHPAAEFLRPPSTSTDGSWKMFYHITGLRELHSENRIPVQAFAKLGKAGEYRANARIRGPGLVALHGW